MIKAIETLYNGYRFRSRLEARWAVFFDSLGVKYEYEPEGFLLPSGKYYLPDFRIKCYGVRGENISHQCPCDNCRHNKGISTQSGDFASWYDEFCEFFVDECPEWITLRRPPERTNIIKCEKQEAIRKPFYLYVEVKGHMTQEDADKICEFAWGENVEKVVGVMDDGEIIGIQNPVLLVGDIPNPEEYYAGWLGDVLKNNERMDGVDIYSWNYELIDGDFFGAYPAVDEEGHFYLDGDDSNYQTADLDVIRQAFRNAKQARFEWGETPNSTNDKKKSTKRKDVTTTRKEYMPTERDSVVAQKLILIWLVNYRSLKGLIMEYIKPEDFTEELYREVATMVYDQARAGEVNVSRLLNHFMDSEQHTLVASLFNETIVLDGEGQMANAFAEAVIRIKRSSMDQMKEGGQENIMAFYQQMKDLQSLCSKRGELSRKFMECIQGENTSEAKRAL